MDWQEKLTEAGFRVSRPRGVVLGILEHSQVPVSPNEIYRQAKKDGHMLSVASIYRTLEVLAGLGMIVLVHSDTSCNSYMLAPVGHRHHIVCSKCERTIEFEGYEDINLMVKKVQEETGFIVQKHLLQLYGLCLECQKVK